MTYNRSHEIVFCMNKCFIYLFIFVGGRGVNRKEVKEKTIAFW